MAKKIRKQNKEGLGVSLGRLAGDVAKGIGGILGFAADLERREKSEYAECGEIEGKIKSGKKIKGAYGLKVKVGLNPDDFKGRKKLPSGKK